MTETRKLTARVTFRAEWDEFVTVEVPADADEFDAECLRDLAVESFSPNLPHGSEEVGHVDWDGDPEFATNKPDEPPLTAWSAAAGHRWATDGRLAIREDCPIRPVKARYESWRKGVDVSGLIVSRFGTAVTPPKGLCLPREGLISPSLVARQLPLLALGDITYGPTIAYVWRGNEPTPIAFVALCRED